MSKSPSLRRIQADIRELALDPSEWVWPSFLNVGDEALPFSLTIFPLLLVNTMRVH